MRTLLAVLSVVLAAQAVCLGSDDTLRRGVPGTYSRPLFMYAERLNLKSDGSYVFTTFYCGTPESDSGSWTVRDGIVVLSAKEERDSKKHSMHFLILVADGDLALKVQDETGGSQNEQEPSRLFLSEKRRANQSSEPTPTSGTSAAGQPLVPAAVVAHL